MLAIVCLAIPLCWLALKLAKLFLIFAKLFKDCGFYLPKLIRLDVETFKLFKGELLAVVALGRAGRDVLWRSLSLLEASSSMFCCSTLD